MRVTVWHLRVCPGEAWELEKRDFAIVFERAGTVCVGALAMRVCASVRKKGAKLEKEGVRAMALQHWDGRVLAGAVFDAARTTSWA